MANIQKRVTKKGETRFRAQVRLKGFPIQSATFRRKTDAAKWIQDTESRIREGRHFKNAKAKRHTFAEMVDRYLETVLSKPQNASRRAADTTKLNWWKAKLGSYTLFEVTAPMIVECREALEAEEVPRLKSEANPQGRRAPATINRYLAALSTTYSTAIEDWGMLDESPVRKGQKLKEPEGRVRSLSDDERQRLLDACRQSGNQHLYPIVLISLSLGLRQGETMNLTWDRVNLQNRHLTVEETKSGERKGLWIPDPVFEALVDLNKQRRIDSPLLFPGRRTAQGTKPADIRRSWEKALAQASISDFRFHDLRHSCATYLVRTGATAPEIAAVLGHKTLAMVKRYAHVGHSHTSSVLERMNKEYLSGTTRDEIESSD